MMPATDWGRRAAMLYTDAYADRYRVHDEQISDGALVHRFGEWLGEVCDRTGRDLDVLDLGCGTGRYFHALRGVRRLVGIDISRPMLERARLPLNAERISAATIELVEGDFLTCEIGSMPFDLVYSIGVLAEHTPFDRRVAARVHSWLKPGGRFAFTAVHPRSFSVPQTWRRRLASTAAPYVPGRAGRALYERLMAGGLYADERRLREVLGACGLVVESLDTYRSDVHLHCLCVARKPA